MEAENRIMVAKDCESKMQGRRDGERLINSTVTVT